MDSDERSFSLGTKFFADLRRAMLTRMVPLFLAILAVALLAHPPGTELESGTTWIVASVLIPVLLFAGWRGYKQQVASYQGYRLFVSPDRLRRVQPGLPEMEISRSEVARILKTPGKSLTVQLRGTTIHCHPRDPRRIRRSPRAPRFVASARRASDRPRAVVSGPPRPVDPRRVRAQRQSSGHNSGCLADRSSALFHRGDLQSLQLDAKAKKAVWFMPLVIPSVAARIWMVWNP